MDTLLCLQAECVCWRRFCKLSCIWYHVDKSVPLVMTCPHDAKNHISRVPPLCGIADPCVVGLHLIRDWAAKFDWPVSAVHMFTAAVLAVSPRCRQICSNIGTHAPTSSFIMLNVTPIILAPLPIFTQGTCAGMPCHSLLVSHNLAPSCSNWLICLFLCGGCDMCLDSF